MKSVLDVLLIVMELFVWVLIAQAVISWLMAFGVINARNQFVATIWRFTQAITEPVLKPIRKIVPSFNGLDLSPMVLILLIYFLRSVIYRYVYPNVF